MYNNTRNKCNYSLLNIYKFRNFELFLKRMLQVVDIAVFCQKVLLIARLQPS